MSTAALDVAPNEVEETDSESTDSAAGAVRSVALTSEEDADDSADPHAVLEDTFHEPERVEAAADRVAAVTSTDVDTDLESDQRDVEGASTDVCEEASAAASEAEGGAASEAESGAASEAESGAAAEERVAASEAESGAAAEDRVAAADEPSAEAVEGVSSETSEAVIDQASEQAAAEEVSSEAAGEAGAEAAVDTAGAGFELSEEVSERRLALLEAAAAGHSPSGGPTLSRIEIEAMRGDAGVRAAIAAARLVEWELTLSPDASAGADTSSAVRAAQAALLTAVQRTRSGNDFKTARALLNAQQALQRVLGHERPTTIVDECAPTPDEPPGLAVSRTRSRRARKRRNKKPTWRGRARRIALLASLPASLLIAWVTYVPPFPEGKAPPSAAALGTALPLSKLRLSGNMVYATAATWGGFDDEQREVVASGACDRARGLGFAGLVVTDRRGLVVYACSAKRRTLRSHAAEDARRLNDD